MVRTEYTIMVNPMYFAVEVENKLIRDSVSHTL